jgi:hypothetical protein
LSKDLFLITLGKLNLYPTHSFQEIRDASVGSYPARKSKHKKDKKRKLEEDYGQLEHLDNLVSDAEISSETSSKFSNISEELASIADTYHELFNSPNMMRKISNFLRGAVQFKLKLGKDSKVDLAAYRLYNDSDLTITDFCILLNALTSRLD